jgi:hypothetical protein
MKVHIASVAAQAVACAMTASAYPSVNGAHRVWFWCWIRDANSAFCGISITQALDNLRVALTQRAAELTLVGH